MVAVELSGCRMILLNRQANAPAPSRHCRVAPTRSLFVSAVVGAIVFGALMHAAVAQEGATDRATAQSGSTGLVVWCYDATRDVVYRELADQCRGSVVSDAEAKKIEDRRASEITKALAIPQPPLVGGRLASIGTAFFVDDDGHLLTNYHVVDGCKAMVVDRPSGKSLPASVAAVDVYHDLALLHVNLTSLHLTIKSPTIARFRAQDLTEPGAFVAAIGYPNEGVPPREPVITTGVLMQVPAASSGERLAMQGDIRHGNSGSPVIDGYGLVVGILNEKINTVAWYRETGAVPPDVGIGLPVGVLVQFLQRNGIHFQYGQAGPVLNADQILAGARPYMGRAECWK